MRNSKVAGLDDPSVLLLCARWLAARWCVRPISRLTARCSSCSMLTLRSGGCTGAVSGASPAKTEQSHRELTEETSRDLGLYEEDNFRGAPKTHWCVASGGMDRPHSTDLGHDLSFTHSLYRFSHLFLAGRAKVSSGVIRVRGSRRGACEISVIFAGDVIEIVALLLLSFGRGRLYCSSHEMDSENVVVPTSLDYVARCSCVQGFGGNVLIHVDPATLGARQAL